MKTEIINSLVAQFAKSNKVSKAKTQAFVDEILKLIPKSDKPVGKPVSEESKRIRQAIIDARDEMKGLVLTAKEIAAKFNTDPICAGNNLKYLMNAGEAVKMVGKKEKEAGQRGRQELLWVIG